MKDCEETEYGDDEEYKELEEKDQAFGPWLRASPLPKFNDEVKKETSSGTCSKSLFTNSNTSKGDPPVKKRIEEGEVNQVTRPTDKATEVHVTPLVKLKATAKEVEEVAESFGTVAISPKFHPGETSKSIAVPKARKWTRKNVPNVPRKPRQATKKKESGKRALVEDEVAEGVLADMRSGDKKQKGDVVMVDSFDKNLEVVLEDQHHRIQ